MQKMAEFLNVLGTAGECLWIYCIIDILFEQRVVPINVFKNKWIVIGANVICATVTILVMNQKVLTSPWTLTVWIVYGVLSACIFWKTDVFSAIAVVGAYCLGLLIIGMLEISITGLLGGDTLIEATTMQNGIHRVVYLMMGIPIWAVLNICFCRWLKRRNFSRDSFKYWIYMSIIGMIGGGFIASQMLSNFSIEVNIIWYLFLVILIMFIYGMFLWQKSQSYKKQMSALERNNELLEKGYIQINRTYNENAKLYHDMSHHFNAIYRLLEQNEIQQAKQYLESILIPFDSDVIAKRTGIELLDVILQEMDIKAQSKKVQLIMDIQQLPQDIVISQKDLCALFVNLLENAIEAAKSNVYVSVKQIHKMLFLQIKNDYITRPIMQDGRLKTTKIDNGKHGWGTRIIEQIVQKYEGNIEYSIEEEYINIQAMLNDI